MNTSPKSRARTVVATPSSHRKIFPHKICPRVGLPRNLLLIGSLTAALRFSKGWVRKDLNLVMGIGCTPGVGRMLR